MPSQKPTTDDQQKRPANQRSSPKKLDPKDQRQVKGGALNTYISEVTGEKQGKF